MDDFRRLCEEVGDAGNMDSDVVDVVVENMDVRDEEVVVYEAFDVGVGDWVRTSVSFPRSGSKGEVGRDK